MRCEAIVLACPCTVNEAGKLRCLAELKTPCPLIVDCLSQEGDPAGASRDDGRASPA